jgi:hypothetical protein
MIAVRLACVLIASVALNLESARVAGVDSEVIEGPWEVATDAGIDGIFLTRVGSATNIRVYHRRGRKEAWGNFGPEREGAGQADVAEEQKRSFTKFDGEHLRIHYVESDQLKSFDLDVTFSAGAESWVGTWAYSGEVANVALKRPEPKAGVVANPFVGDWVGEADEPFVSAGNLHIRQSSDGMLSAWLDREDRNGELLYVYSADAALRIYMPGEIGPSSRFIGELSEDGRMLRGKWTQVGAGRMGVPVRFRKASE